MTRIAKVPFAVSTTKVLEEIERNGHLWTVDCSRQQRIRCQRETETIFIRSTRKPLEEGVKSEDARQSVWSRYSNDLPEVRRLSIDFSQRLLGELGRIFLVRLRGNGTVYEHSDSGSYYESRDRFHLVLDAELPLKMKVGSQEDRLNAGEAWWFDNQAPYTLINPSSRYAVYLIIDLLPLTQRPRPQSAYKHFEKLEDVDIRPFLAELQSNDELWDADTSRQTNIRVQRETSNIPLRGAAKPVPTGIAVRDVHPSRDTALADSFPLLYRWIERFTEGIGGELGRVAIVRLNPEGTVHPHIDEGEYYLSRDRYHLVLISPSGSEMICGDETVFFQEGELWWFDNKADHRAHNRSNIGRVHVIFDVKPRRTYPELPSLITNGMVSGRADLSGTLTAPVVPVITQESCSAGIPNHRSEIELLAASFHAWLTEETKTIEEADKAWHSHSQVNPECLWFIRLRAEGRGLSSYWLTSAQIPRLFDLLDDVRRELGADVTSILDVVEIFQVCETEWIGKGKTCLATYFKNSQRGLIGFEVESDLDSHAIRYSPTEMIAENRDFEKAYTELCKSHPTISENDSIKSIRGRQYLIRLQPVLEKSEGTANQAIVELFRGRSLVPVHRITATYLENLANLLGSYLIRSIEPDGRMQYLYYPSRGTEDSRRNNQIRQWMASLALCRFAAYNSDASTYAIAYRNIQYNLTHYFRRENRFGLIDDSGRIKLGALSIAALAIRHHPARGEFADVESSLYETIQSLWMPTGRFKTFLVPAERDDCQNFYPGETLLLWAEMYRECKSDELFYRYTQSAKYYQVWHQEHLNPAFIPWHTQAYWLMWCQLMSELENGAHTLERGRFLDFLRDAIFKMSDWLLTIQQWDDAPEEDMRGRFYAPDKPYGPPHASSTAVYLEGLIDAYQLATRLGDATRSTTYRESILRGFRSIAQLTFKDDIDMFYVSRPERVRGGVATTVYDNQIRIDNVQHSLMACLKALQTGLASA